MENCIMLLIPTSYFHYTAYANYYSYRIECENRLYGTNWVIRARDTNKSDFLSGFLPRFRYTSAKFAGDLCQSNSTPIWRIQSTARTRD